MPFNIHAQTLREVGHRVGELTVDELAAVPFEDWDWIAKELSSRPYAQPLQENHRRNAVDGLSSLQLLARRLTEAIRDSVSPENAPKPFFAGKLAELSVPVELSVQKLRQELRSLGLLDLLLGLEAVYAGLFAVRVLRRNQNRLFD